MVVVGEPCRPNPFGIIEGRDVTDTPDLPGVRIDAIDLLVIRLDSVKKIVNRDHAVPGAVGLEIVGRQSNVLGGMSLLERAEVRDLVPGPVVMYAEHRVNGTLQAVTATGAGQNGVELVPDEGYVGDPAHQVALVGTGLAGGQSVGDRGALAVPVKLGNARGKSAAVRTRGSGNLRTVGRRGGL